MNSPDQRPEELPLNEYLRTLVGPSDGLPSRVSVAIVAAAQFIESVESRVRQLAYSAYLNHFLSSGEATADEMYDASEFADEAVELWKNWR